MQSLELSLQNFSFFPSFARDVLSPHLSFSFFLFFGCLFLYFLRLCFSLIVSFFGLSFSTSFVQINFSFSFLLSSFPFLFLSFLPSLSLTFLFSFSFSVLLSVLSSSFLFLSFLPFYFQSFLLSFLPCFLPFSLSFFELRDCNATCCYSFGFSNRFIYSFIFIIFYYSLLKKKTSSHLYSFFFLFLQVNTALCLRKLPLLKSKSAPTSRISAKLLSDTVSG